MVAVTSTDAMDMGTTWTSHSTNGDAVEIPDSYLLFNAEFGRVGFDLTLTDDQGHSMRIADYFRHEQSPDLVSPDGAKLTGSVVEKLAGPQFPGQYSQAGDPAGQQTIAIGQVESTSAGSTVKRADGSVEPLAEGTKVFQNDVVQTVEGGKLSITFIDGTIFTLASKSRMLLDELVYDPASTENSAVFNLIEGSFVFIAGKAAKTGGMEINTPVATLGIRGTTVKVDIESINGVITVDVSLNRDPDGSIGSIVLTDLSGDVIANITATDSKWVVSPVEGDTREIQRTASEISADQVIISEAVRAFTKSQQRVDDGGEFVEGAEQSGQETPAEDGEEPSETESEPEQEAAPENGEQAPEGNEPAPEGGDQAPEGEQQGNLGEQGGSGLETASATDELTTIDGGGSSTTEPLDGSTGQQQAAADPLAPNPTPNTTVANNTPAPDSGPAVTPTPVQNAAPVITFPSLSPSVNEDGSVALSGFSISDPEGSTLTATLTAGSTISIAPSTGVTIISGTGTDDTQLVISGTGQQISDALNSATYKPTPNDDDGGTLTVSVSDGSNTSTQTLVVDIVPSQDAPTAADDTITRTEDSNLFFGDVTLNDSDPDTTPTPDVLTVQSATDSGEPFGGGTSTGGTAITVGAAQTLTNGGDFTIFSDGQYTFDPGSAYDHLAGGETAVETIDYVINDGNGNIDDATLTINVTGVNDAPVAAGLPSAISADEGQSANVDLSGLSLSDVDANGGNLVVTLSTGTGAIVGTSGTGVTATSISNTEITLEGSIAALNAYLTSTGSGSQVTYTGAANIEGNGADAIAVSVSDEQTAGGDQNVSIGSISVDITPGNNPPVAVDDSAPAQDDNVAVTGNVLINDSDSDAGDTLTVSSTGTLNGTYGTLTMGANGDYSYIVTDLSFDEGEMASDVFSVTVSDGTASASSLLTINITGTNNAPTISVTNPTALTEGTQGVLTVETIDLTTLLNAVDPDIEDSPEIDPDSIVITENTASVTEGMEIALNVSGTNITVDTGIFDVLEAGEIALFDVTFEVNSGPDTSSHTVTIAINGEAGSSINEIYGTANGETLNGTSGNDFIYGGGNSDNGNEILFGNAGGDVLVGSANSESFHGGEGNDTIITGDSPSDRGDYYQGSNGNDRINYGGAILGYQGVSYGALAAGIVVSIDAAANTATVDKGINGTDTFIDIVNPLESEKGGFGINGTQYNDTFNLDTGSGTWMQVNGGRGVDTYNIISGTVRLNLQSDENFSLPDNGINVNLATKTIIDDGFGNTETITGPGAVREILGTDFDDIMIGSNADESFIGRRGNDVIDGGGGFDRIRYERTDVGSVDVNLEEGIATGYWGKDQFNHTLSNIEHVRGSNLGVDFIAGSSAGGELLDGRDGTDILDGRGGDDTLTGGKGSDVFFAEEIGSGHDTITDFTLGVDRIIILEHGTTYATAVQSLTFDGTDTLVSFTGGTDSLTIEGVDLTSAEAEDIFTFNFVAGTDNGDAYTGPSTDDVLTGTAGNDLLVGFDGGDIIHGGDGNDTLASGTSDTGFKAERDQLFGDAGDDLLIAEQDSNVRLVGGEGDDVIQIVNASTNNDETKWWENHLLDYSTSTSGITANLTSGTFGSLESGQIADGFGDVDTVGGIQNIGDSDFDDVFIIDSELVNRHGANRVEVRLSEGDDSVDFTTSSRGRVSYQDAKDGVDANLASGVAIDRNLANGDQIGTDTFINATELKGSKFDDLLTGDGNNNTLQGREGNDTLDGGGGDDSAAHWGADSRIEVDLSFATGQVISDGRGGTDTLINIEGVSGSLFADRLDGSNGEDSLQGYAGNDVLIGRGGNDYLSGDYNSGAAGFLGGNDFLAGGTGNDNLHGGDNADVFYFKSGDDFDYIDDFNITDGDKIDVSEFALTNTGDFSQFTFDGTNTFIEFATGDAGVTVANVNLTTLSNPDDAFIFDVINYSGPPNTLITGTSGDDHIRLNSSNGFFGIGANTGNDIIDFTLAQSGTQQLVYYVGPGASAISSITVTIDAASNMGTVDKGPINGTDTLFNVINPLQSGYNSNGGLFIDGTTGNDTFNLDNGDISWMNLSEQGGNDTIVIDSGLVRLSYYSATSGINANLAAGTISDGLGGTDTISGDRGVWEILGTDFDDIITGSGNDESFIGQRGNDVIDGGGGIDRIRYERTDVASIRVDLDEGSATGFWGTDVFNHTLSNIEHVRGSKLGVDFIDGSSAGGEILDGRAGTDFLNGRGGDDTLTGGTQTDIFVMEAGSGHDTITDFELGVDGIGAFGYGTTFATAVQSLTFDGTDTQVVFTGGTDSLTIEGVDLTSAAPEDIFAFVQIDGTEGDDELIGTAQNEGLFGLGGSDILHGGGGNDILFSGTSPGGYNGYWDQIFGDAGNDLLIANQDSFVRLVGGAGDDVIKVVNVSVSDDETKWYEGHVLDYSTSTSGITANLTSGTYNNLASGQIADGLGGVDTVDGIQQIADSDFDDVFVIDSQLINKHGANRVEVRLSEGDDSVDFTTSSKGRVSFQYAKDGVDANLDTGTAVDYDLFNGDQIGNDSFINATELKGSSYDDLLTGDANNNTFQGRGGNDTLDGAGGFDTAAYWGTRSRIEVDLQNEVYQVLSDGRGGSDTLIDIEQIAGSLFADNINGSSNDDNLQGYAGNDVLDGDDGNDYLGGDYGAGAAGHLGGNDFLAGEGGNDTLFGGDNADTFAFGSGDGYDTIQDFNFTDGDKIDLSFMNFSSTGDFTQFQLIGGDTVIEFESGVGVTVQNVDLTALSDPNDAFIFSATTGWVGASTIGTSGDDHIRPVSDQGNNFITATAGDDIIDYTFAQETFQELSYSGNTLATDITVTIDAVANNGNGTVVKGGGVGTDTLFNILNPLQSGSHTNGGFHIIGTIGNDTFNLDGGEVSWMNVSGLDGNDTFDIDSGAVRLSYGSAFTGINANLVTGTITDGLGGTDTVSGAQGAWEIQGSDFVDTFIGSANDESFITRGGNDIVDGGAGFDRVRYDRPGIGSDAIDANLQTGTVTGQWNGVAFTDTISNIEAVRGGSGDDTITGTTADEKFQGKDGNDTIIGGGGEDQLYGDNGDDTISVTDGNYDRADGGLGQDTLVIEGGGQQIDYTLSDASQTMNFENFDLGTGDGSTEVTANEQNVLDVTDEENLAIAAVLGDGFSALLVDGDASDIVNLESTGDISGGSWILDSGDSTTYSGYDVYHYTDSTSTFARIVIDDDIQVVVA